MPIFTTLHIDIDIVTYRCSEAIELIRPCGSWDLCLAKTGDRERTGEQCSTDRIYCECVHGSMLEWCNVVCS